VALQRDIVLRLADHMAVDAARDDLALVIEQGRESGLEGRITVGDKQFVLLEMRG